MGEASGGKVSGKRKSSSVMEENHNTPSKITANYISSKRGLFKDYTHIYTEDGKKEYPILLSSIEANTKMDLLKTTSIMKTCLGLTHVKPVGNFIIKAFFCTKKDANALLLNKELLGSHGWQAKIPYDNIESMGVIRAPIEISEENLLTNIKSSAEIIGVKRFTRKNPDGSTSPTPTVLITFLSSTRPDHVTYDYIWFDVKEYVKPLRQCFTCYKFGHGRGSCRSSQVCSICSAAHFFKDCNNKDNLKCINCKGPHMAVSAVCPVKAAKIQDVKDKISGKTTFATVTARNTSACAGVSSITSSKSTIPKKGPQSQGPQARALFSDLLNSDEVLNIFTKTLVELLKVKMSQNDTTISTKVIKEALISNLSQ